MTKTITDEPSGADSKGATEDQVERIKDVKGSEVLGQQGGARAEHSGQVESSKPKESTDK